MNDEITIETGPENRLLVAEWTNCQGRRLVTVTPQYRDRAGSWHLSRSSLMLGPDAARELGPALALVAANIDAGPVDPMPTEQDREESRMP